MYGMVNNFIEHYIQQHYGDKTWKGILKETGLDNEYFVTMEQYNDDITYQMVSGFEKVTGVPAQTLLSKIGENWIDHTKEEYAHYFSMGGDNTFGFLANLNGIHSSLSHILTELKPPIFNCKTIDPQTLEVIYTSHRPGLTPFVTGLFKGLAKYFNENIQCTLITEKTEPDLHECVFILKKTA